SRTSPWARRGWPSTTTASRLDPSTAARPGCWCRTCTSGGARNGYGAWNCAITTNPVSGRPTATTCTENRGKNSGTRATDLAGRHRDGQHLDVRLTAEDGHTAERSYSIASADAKRSSRTSRGVLRRSVVT